MAQEKELEIEGGSLKYSLTDKGVIVVSASAAGLEMRIPGEIEEKPVIRLEKKALLSDKRLCILHLPDSLLEIGDWAFAYCSNLEQVFLPKRQLVLGKGIFKECYRLESICPLEAGEIVPDREKEQAGKLLGAVPVKLEADYLMTPENAGETIWLSRFDERLSFFLEQPDEEGYVKQVYCGEEDIMSNLDLYLEERRRAKSRLCFLRLLNPINLSGEFRQELSAYLREHTLGCQSQAAWEVVFGEHGSRQEYYAAFTEAGCLTAENYQGILQDMGENYPEMKAYLMGYKTKYMESTDFFAELSLD